MLALTANAVPGAEADDRRASAVFLDLDTVLLGIYQGRRGLELGLQADLDEALDRLEEVAEKIVVLVEPPPPESQHGRETEARLKVLREGLGDRLDRLILVRCSPEDEALPESDCGKPHSGLIERAIRRNKIGRRDAWHIGGDEEGVVAGRGAGLRTIRVGPLPQDPLSNIHRADYEARDLLDAANRILLETLSPA
jgi:histidinol phosphatase-like enzyme